MNIFTREAVALIYERSRGIPRTISVMCDNALISGFALGRWPVDEDILLEVCRDFDFSPSSSIAAHKSPHLALVLSDAADAESSASS